MTSTNKPRRGKAAAGGGRPSRSASKRSNRSAGKDDAGAPRLLSGGNPQVAKGDGPEPVSSYLGAMPGCKQEIGRALDALAERSVPGLLKAVRWNSPFYGTAKHGWFMNMHCVTKYVKVAFFNGTSLTPQPPVASKNEGTRYVHLYEGEALDEAQLARWIKQAAKLPGWQGFGPQA